MCFQICLINAVKSWNVHESNKIDTLIRYCFKLDDIFRNNLVILINDIADVTQSRSRNVYLYQK